MSNLPFLDQRHRICIISEGGEDNAYIKKLIALQVWNSIYDIKPIDVGSASSIFPRYQSLYQNNSFAAILVFCDTDKYPYKEYKLIKKKINEFHNKTSASSKVVIFANPCTMQIILSHFGDIILKTQSKKTNAPIIYDLTGVKDYDAHEEQVKAICKQITKSNYKEMKKRIAKINFGDETSGSTNFIDFIDKFESNEPKWIKAIEQALRE